MSSKTLQYEEIMSKYKQVNGTFYHVETNDEVIRVLENCRESRTRIVLDYGDTKTGNSWNEVYDVTGRVGRSGGVVKIPILVHNSRSMGGGAIFDHCIIGIKESKGGRVMYAHELSHQNNTKKL